MLLLLLYLYTYRRPSSMPGPRKEEMLVRLALSNEDLKINLMPKLSAKNGITRGWALVRGMGCWGRIEFGNEIDENVRFIQLTAYL